VKTTGKINRVISEVANWAEVPAILAIQYYFVLLQTLELVFLFVRLLLFLLLAHYSILAEVA